ncbi:hypothetical protein Q7V28_05095 [Streptococcus suis]|nr:hypothetical protein [Streptococcus suis]MDW8601382.1 hypothetical protein [Streptococcus suis]
MKILWERLFKFVQQYFREKKTAKITMVLSIIMAFGISYLLILPAITLETDSQESVLQSVYNQPTTVEQPVRLQVLPSEDSTKYIGLVR